MTEDAFTMPDGARLPYRAWLPDGARRRRWCWRCTASTTAATPGNIPAPASPRPGMAVYAPDQRGFGEAPGRGLWPGTEALVDDAAEMARLLRALHPGVKLVLMGESMGAAVLMVLATGRRRRRTSTATC